MKLKYYVMVIFLPVLVNCSDNSKNYAETKITLPVDEAEKILFTGLDAIISKYIDKVPVERLVLEGLKGLYILDPSISISINHRFIELYYKKRFIFKVVKPLDDNINTWSRSTVNVLLMTQSTSHKLNFIQPEKIYNAFFKGSINALDEFSSYSDHLEATRNRKKREGLFGVGILLHVDNKRILVTKVTPNSPADSAGIRAGDQIISINNEKLSELSIRLINDKLEGSKGSIVSVIIYRIHAGNMTVELKREQVIQPTVTSSIYNSTLYLKISSFNMGTASSLINILRQKLSGGMEYRSPITGIVLDLRGNPGGLLNQSIEVADAFLINGRIVNTQGRHPGSIQEYRATRFDEGLGLPMAVLVDGQSASGAEIVAAALQDGARAIILGTTSFGKGTIQTITQLPNNGELKLTWAYFLAPSGYNLDGLGVLPSVCTSGNIRLTPSFLKKLPATYKLTHKTLMDWRSYEYKDIHARESLRSKCPPEAHQGDRDLQLAQRIIKDKNLYYNALKIASNHVENIK